MDAWIRNIMKSMAFASGSSRESSFEPEILLCKRSRVSTSSATTVLSATSLSSASTSASSRSYDIQQVNNNNNTSNNTSNSNNKCSKNSESRIANWDKKREKCRNCTLIYLKTLSRHPGFCSVDCKSNAAYLEKVNRTIRAMKDAVEQRQQHEKDEAVKAAAAQETPVVAVCAPQPQAVEEPVHDEDEDDNSGRTPQAAHTFSEFGLESRILDASNVEWAFSALY